MGNAISAPAFKWVHKKSDFIGEGFLDGQMTAVLQLSSTAHDILLHEHRLDFWIFFGWFLSLNKVALHPPWRTLFVPAQYIYMASASPWFRLDLIVFVVGLFSGSSIRVGGSRWYGSVPISYQVVANYFVSMVVHQVYQDVHCGALADRSVPVPPNKSTAWTRSSW